MASLFDSAVAKFQEVIPSEDSYANFRPSQIDHLVDSATGSL